MSSGALKNPAGTAEDRPSFACPPDAGGLRWRRERLFRGLLVVSCLVQVAAGPPAMASGQELPPPAAPVVGPAGSLLILTAPPGVAAWTGDRYLGTTPVRIDSLPPGRVELVLAPPSPGARWRPPCLVRADIQAGRTDTLRVDLRAAGGNTLVGGETSWVRAELRETHSPLSRVETVLPAAAVGLGAAGAWARQAADRAYRDYRRTLDRGLMNDRFHRAQRLDRVSIACWIGAEACLAGAAWVWLRRDDRASLSTSVDAEGTVRLGVRVRAGSPPAPAQRGSP